MNTPNNTANDRLGSRHDGAAPQPNPSLLARGSHALQEVVKEGVQNHPTQTTAIRESAPREGVNESTTQVSNRSVNDSASATARQILLEGVDT